MRLLLIVLLICTVSPTVGVFGQDAPPSETARATDRLNLRSGPATSYTVVTVIPTGQVVTLTGEEANGFRSVLYNGQAGWAFAAYLSITAPQPSPNSIATTTDRLNLRNGPGTTFAVLVVVPNGGIVTLAGPVSNGYYQVTWGAYSGWVSGGYLAFGSTPPPTEPPPTTETNAVTTDSLNLRRGPGITFAVIVVMPPNTRVVDTGQRSNGYRSIAWNGQNGWAAEAYLTLDGTLPLPEATAKTLDRLNLRSAPNTSSSVLTVIPLGASITLTGQSTNGFRSTKYLGYTGWAFDAYLRIDSTPAPPTPVPPTPLPPTPTPPPIPDAPYDVTNTIVGPARGSADAAIAFARRAGSKRMDQVELYMREIFRLAPQLGMDPAILIAQSALETAYWKSDWWTLRLNPAGIGITGHPAQENASPTFANGTIAARAQMAHMHAEVFGSSRPLPTVLQGVDPTYQRVFEAGWAGTIVTIDDLAGTWAVDPLYGQKIVNRAKELFPQP